GTKYNGGGGFIEYSDVEGKLSKAMPDVAKQLGYEFKELSDGGGYFRDVITKKRVERGKLEQVMNGLLNEKDRKQLQINAWGKYDGMSDEGLEASYTSFYAPVVSELEGKVQSLTDLVASTTNPSQLAEYQKSLEIHKEQLESYEGSSYD